MADPRPVIAECKPVVLNLEPGEYWWCQCGKSQSQPFCDGSHKVEGIFKPVMFEIKDGTRSVKLCRCKQTRSAPYCDQTHRQLEECQE